MSERFGVSWDEGWASDIGGRPGASGIPGSMRFDPGTSTGAFESAVRREARGEVPRPRRTAAVFLAVLDALAVFAVFFFDALPAVFLATFFLVFLLVFVAVLLAVFLAVFFEVFFSVFLLVVFAVFFEVLFLLFPAVFFTVLFEVFFPAVFSRLALPLFFRPFPALFVPPRTEELRAFLTTLFLLLDFFVPLFLELPDRTLARLRDAPFPAVVLRLFAFFADLVFISLVLVRKLSISGTPPSASAIGP